MIKLNLFLYYFITQTFTKSLFKLPVHYSQADFDAQNYDYTDDYKYEKSFFIFSVGGEGFLNFFNNRIGEPIHLEDMPDDAAPFYIWEDDEMGGLILGTEEFYTDPRNDRIPLLMYDPNNKFLSIYDYNDEKGHRFYFRAIGLNLYKILVDGQCLYYSADGDGIGVKNCSEATNDQRELFELYDDQDMLYLEENDDNNARNNFNQNDGYNMRGNYNNDPGFYNDMPPYGPNLQNNNNEKRYDRSVCDDGTTYRQNSQGQYGNYDGSRKNDSRLSRQQYNNNSPQSYNDGYKQGSRPNVQRVSLPTSFEPIPEAQPEKKRGWFRRTFRKIFTGK